MNGMKALDSLGDFRRNVVTRGIPAAALQAAVGRQIRLGDEVVVFVHRSTVPCHHNERKMERPGFVEVCWDVSGVSCEVLVGGQLRQGDAVRICGGEPQHDKVDEGQQTPGYFVRPSQRTKAQVRQAAAQRTALLPRLLEVDPAGVVRAVENYQTVGLKMFSRPKRFRRAQALQDRFLTMIGIFLFLIAFMVGQQKFHDHVQVYGGFDAWWDIVMPSLLGGRGAQRRRCHCRWHGNRGGGLGAKGVRTARMSPNSTTACDRGDVPVFSLRSARMSPKSSTTNVPSCDVCSSP